MQQPLSMIGKLYRLKRQEFGWLESRDGGQYIDAKEIVLIADIIKDGINTGYTIIYGSQVLIVWILLRSSSFENHFEEFDIS